jgi:hypothetical protein
MQGKAMRTDPKLVAVFVAALAGTPAAAQEAEMTWAKAAGYLKQEQEAGEGCARVIKRFLPPGDPAAQSRAELDYDKARSAFNGLITELQTALADKTEAAALGDFQAEYAAGAAAREVLCRQAKVAGTTAESGGEGRRRGGLRGGRQAGGRADPRLGAHPRRRRAAAERDRHRARRRGLAAVRRHRVVVGAHAAPRTSSWMKRSFSIVAGLSAKG